MNDLAHKWKDLRVQLLRSDQEKILDIIAVDHPRDVVSCCRCVFKKSEAIDTDQSVALMVVKVTIDTDRWKVRNENVY